MDYVFSFLLSILRFGVLKFFLKFILRISGGLAIKLLFLVLLGFLLLLLLERNYFSLFGSLNELLVQVLVDEFSDLTSVSFNDDRRRLILVADFINHINL